MTFGISQARVDNVAGGGANLLRPLVDAGFQVDKVRRDTKYAKKDFLLEQRRAAINPGYVPAAQKSTSTAKFIILIVVTIIALIVGLAMFAGSTATRSSKRGIVGSTKSGKRVRRVRKKPKK